MGSVPLLEGNMIKVVLLVMIITTGASAKKKSNATQERPDWMPSKEFGPLTLAMDHIHFLELRIMKEKHLKELCVEKKTKKTENYPDDYCQTIEQEKKDYKKFCVD